MLGKLSRIFGRRAAAAPEAGEGLIYIKAGESAFALECKYTGNEVADGVTLVALVETVERAEDPAKSVIIVRVATASGYFRAFAIDAGGRFSAIAPGDLIAWSAMEYSASLVGALDEDARSGWMGLVTSTLQTVYDPNVGWLKKS
jgi:hypothetical protein